MDNSSGSPVFARLRPPLTALLGRLLRLSRRFSRIEEELDGLVQDLQAYLASRAEGVPPQRRPAGATTRVRGAEKVWRQILAARGAAALEWVSETPGGAVVRIDGGEPVVLKAGAARLLHLLAAPGSSAAEDGMVGWKSFKELRVAMSLRADRPLTPAALRQAVHMLRSALLRQGVLPELVQTHPRKGYRFAVRPAGQSGASLGGDSR